MSFTRNNSNQQRKKAEILSNLLFLPRQKIIVVNDKIGCEPQAKELVNQWITEQRGNSSSSNSNQTATCVVDNLTESVPFLLMPISRLERRFEPRQLFQFVSQCKRNSTIEQLCVWVSESKLKQPFLLPYLEHMADTVLSFEDGQHVALLVKKSSGAVTHKYYTLDVPSTTKTIYVTETTRAATKGEDSTAGTEEPSLNPATLGTFKIDLKEEEIKAKNALTLPFEFYKTTSEGGKILYHPDAEDDLDEEDPDDDLLI